MAKTTGSDERIDQVREPISFGRKALSSETFLALFREGMALLEETADYLDGPGREESRELSRVGSLARPFACPYVCPCRDDGSSFFATFKARVA